jgi:hypothetical protein
MKAILEFDLTEERAELLAEDQRLQENLAEIRNLYF